MSAGWSAYTSVFSASAVDVAAIKADVDDISNDNKISPPEKPSLIIDYNPDRGAIGPRLAGDRVRRHHRETTYDNNLTALTSYMATLTSPVLWSNKTDYTTVVGATMRTKFQDVFTARTALVNKLAAVAKSIADGKILYFRQTTTPTTTVVGSLWFNPDTGVTSSWDGTSWIATIDSSPGSESANLVPNSNFTQNTSATPNNVPARWAIL